MADYDIGEAFRGIEHELIASMNKNLLRHRAEESELGFNWAQWQVVQIRELERYRLRNADKFDDDFNEINQELRRAIQDNYNTGATKQERRILQNIKRMQKGTGENLPNYSGTSTISGEFFKVNDRKLDALIEATTHDMTKAEYAVLRHANDQYRKIIFNAQVYANTGAGTYEKALDMACRDFLNSGINCIQYSNGRMVPIDVYAEMALRTASKRAYLQGEGEMRKKWGIHTVILNKRTNACPKCAPFCGKVIVDDVWSGGTAQEAIEGGYLLMSDCIADGLYHPNCQDSHTTYFGDFIDSEDEQYPDEDSENGEPQYTAEELLQPVTEEEQQLSEELYEAQQRQNHCERQVQRFERLSEFSFDEENRQRYHARLREWEQRRQAAEKMVNKLEKDVEIAAESGIIEAGRVNPISIRSIDMPIEQRNTGKGNPNAMLMFGVELNNRQKGLLERLPDFDSRIVVNRNSVNMKDLAALTAFTGDEFAMFTKGNERLIIRGSSTMVNIDVREAERLAGEGYRWSGHTHPGTNLNCMISSPGDHAVLNCFPQHTSVIYNSKGQFRTFEKEE